MCLNFWYHMFGLDVETLNVYLVTDKTNYTRIWTRSASQGNVWKLGQAPVSSDKIYQVSRILSNSDEIVLYVKNLNANNVCFLVVWTKHSHGSVKCSII